ncbi:sigma-70 family RNA polymerase sigma factor [Streptococcus panodentis]|uniref:Transcriptional regulator n=1 Tax=Streptococcus panodentis TaxID=1581472 RepID=A0ABS5AUG5_9STRE|nr:MULTISPECIES: sigma-70 family RNA polymerase sigma factor [Streptococcus]KXT84888.1 Competence-specific sigma factor ComX [Streptococcus sp. DD11]MBP2620215.1 transcriptional regulator [Streptococcus panodentis]
MDFKETYDKVKWIVWKCQKNYYVHLWEKSDWEQEGMLVLYELLQQEAGIEEDESKLYRYFKTKFRNHIHDIIRKQESQKRRLDRQPYEEVSDISHRLQSKELFLDELVAFREAIGHYKETLDAQGQENYQRLLGNERFKGRRAMLRDLEEHLQDFRNSTIL